MRKEKEEVGKKIPSDLKVQRRAITVSYYSIFILAIVISILQFVFTKKVGMEIWMICFGMLSVTFFVKFLMRKKRHELFIFLCYALIFSFTTITFVFQLLGKI